jgi:LacI family transcriptional regulator
MSRKLEDIAKLAGVSRSTVSRVINNDPHVSKRTRQRVQRVIQEENFRPNMAARALVTRQAHVLSLVIPQAVASTFTDPYFPLLMQGITLEANQRNYAVMLWIGSSAEEEERFAQRILNNSLFDGVLIASVINGDVLVGKLAQAGFPFVLIGPPFLDGLNYVDTNNIAGAQSAVEHLVRLGYQRIGTIAGPQNQGAAQDRLKGYCRGLSQHGRAFDPALVVEGEYSEEAGHAAMRVLLERGVDAVFAASDMIAFGALRAARECGLRVPEDVAVVGFDDIPAAAAAQPPLTTVRQPIRDLGAHATRALIGLLEGTLERPYQESLSAHLIVRESCGAARRQVPDRGGGG